MTTVSIDGGCLCRAVRYRVAGKPIAQSLCHCRTCRLASGAPSVAWVVFPSRDFAFVTGQPASFRSSPEVVRTFCAHCGSPLTYRHDSSPDTVDHDCNARLSGPFRPHARNLARAQTRMGKTQREPGPLSEEQHGRAEHLVLSPWRRCIESSVGSTSQRRARHGPGHRAKALSPGYTSDLRARSRIESLFGEAIKQAGATGAFQAFVAAAARRMRRVPGTGRIISP